MNTLDDLIKQTLQAHAAQAGGSDVAEEITRRIRSQDRRRVAGSVVVLAAAAGVGVWGLGDMLSGDDLVTSPAATTLIDAGECAGLTVAVGAPNPGPSSESNPRPPLNAQTVKAGVTTVSMGRQDHLWFQASGPCHEQLVLISQGSVVRGMDGSELEPFSPAGEGSSGATMFTNTQTDATEDLALVLTRGCKISSCDTVATIQVVVSAEAQSRGGEEGTTETAPPTP